MSAAELRKAAETLRKAADKASTGDGPTLSREWFWDLTYRTRNMYEVIAKDEGSVIAERLNRWTATYIATMHPGVGLALADLLDHLASDGEAGLAIYTPTISLARLINGGAA